MGKGQEMRDFLMQFRALFLASILGVAVWGAGLPEYKWFPGFKGAVEKSMFPGEGAIKIGKIKGRVRPAEFIYFVSINKAKTNRIMAGGPVDRAFFCPSISEVVRLISLVKNEMLYTPEVYDCDDFSRHFKEVLMRTWAAEGNQFPLAVAEVYGALEMPDGEIVYHAWNAIITDEGHLIYIEPQVPQAVALRKVKILYLFKLEI